DQGALLRAVLARPEDKRELAYEALLGVYLTGDSARILETDEKLSARDLPPGLWDKMRAILIDRRNALMATRIIERMGEGKLFVAVGAAHLPGEQGIVRRLRAAGYRLTPLR
ncbi:MAG: TraB/GumN family protein, partial [Methylobacterium sp.]|nr:TraB/GumN family protein [Methylobacterium sp.]